MKPKNNLFICLCVFSFCLGLTYGSNRIEGALLCITGWLIGLILATCVNWFVIKRGENNE